MILKINDRFRNLQVAYFTDVTVDMKYDAFASTFQLAYYFDPNNVDHKEFSCVSHYHICTLIADNGELLLTGFVLSIKFKDSSKKSLCMISGYSLPGVLEDCDIAPSVPEKFQRLAGMKLLPYSLQFYGLSLKEVAESLVAPFGIKVVVDRSVASEMQVKYEETEAKETQSIKSFLSELASQKNIIISHNQYGDLVFKRPSAGAPVFEFEDGVISDIEMEMSFNGQAVHSQITVMKQSNIEEQGISDQQTIYNPYVTTVFRPKVHKLTQKSAETDAEDSAKNLRAKELRSLGLTIQLDRYILNERVLRPGDTIAVTNPRVYLFNRTEFFIESVGIKQDAAKTTATLNCCLPEAITGAEPVSIFRGINLHPIV